MMTIMLRLSRFIALAGCLLAAASCCLAQGDSSAGLSLTGSLSDPVTAGSPESGFNSSFDQTTSSFTNGAMHSDVNDPTHAQLVGSTLSPLDDALVNAAVQTAPRTGILSDAQMSVGLNDFGFGGRQNRSFLPGSGAHTLSSVAARPSSNLYGTAATQAAFTGGMSANAAFNGRAARAATQAQGFSGEAASPATQGTEGSSALSSAQPAMDANGRDRQATVMFTDPVLTGSSAGYDTGPEMHGDLPVPSTVTASFFATAPRPDPAFQYDDGQTPLGGRPALAGSVLGGAPEYLRSTTGFPDSTKGQAGSITSLETGVSPLSAPPTPSGSPFSPVSGGEMYQAKTRLNPNLKAQIPRPTGSFEEYERRLRRTRLASGATISQADSVYRQDLKDYRRTNGKAGRRSTLTQPTQGLAGFQQDPAARKPIR